MSDQGAAAEAVGHDFDFFISRDGADRAWAEWIAWQIEEFEPAPGVRYRVLLQDWDFVPGLDWAAWMEHSIQRAAQVIPVLSPDYVTNQRPGAVEWWGFWGADPYGRQRRVLPVRVRECSLDGPFGSIAGIDLAGISEPEAIERLRQAVVAMSPGRRGPLVPPGFPGGGRAVAQHPGFPGGWAGPAAAGGAAVGGIAGRMSDGFGPGAGAGGGGAPASPGGWQGNAGTENAGAGWPGNSAAENVGPGVKSSSGAENAGAGWPGQPGVEPAGAGYPGAGQPGTGWQQGSSGTGWQQAQPGMGWQGQPGAGWQGQPAPGGWQGQPGGGWQGGQAGQPYPPGPKKRSRTPMVVAAIAVVVAVIAALVVVINPFDGGKSCTVDNYVTSVRLAGQEATAATQKGSLPSGTADGPAVTVPPTTTVVNGGSLQVPITASGSFVKLLVGIEVAGDSEQATAECYYEVNAAGPVNTENLLLTIAQDLPSTTFTFSFAAVNGEGKQGIPGKQVAEAIQVETGEAQVSLSWDAESDVDLHVVDPNGDEVYYENNSVASGGVLDLDSNAGCSIDGKNNENIAWTTPPAGVYSVRVDYYDSCGVTETNYVVTVQVAGQEAQIFSGRLVGAGDQGGEGSGDEITTFRVGS